jgi:hypothetical protein
MTGQQPRYSKEEYARRGGEIYEQQIRSQVEAGNKAKTVAIDIETTEYALGENILAAAQPLLDRNSDAQIWVVRIGHRAVHRIGARSLPDKMMPSPFRGRQTASHLVPPELGARG